MGHRVVMLFIGSRGRRGGNLLPNNYACGVCIYGRYCTEYSTAYPLSDLGKTTCSASRAIIIIVVDRVPSSVVGYILGRQGKYE